MKSELRYDLKAGPTRLGRDESEANGLDSLLVSIWTDHAKQVAQYLNEVLSINHVKTLPVIVEPVIVRFPLLIQAF